MVVIRRMSYVDAPKESFGPATCAMAVKDGGLIIQRLAWRERGVKRKNPAFLYRAPGVRFFIG